MESDGQSVAVADLAGDIQIKSVIVAGDRSVEITPLPDPQIDLKSSNIKQMLFSPDNSMLLISTAKDVFVYSVQETRLLATTYLEPLAGDRKWFRHPTDPCVVVACASRDAQVYDWATMEPQGSIKFEEPTNKPANDSGLGASTPDAMVHYSSPLLVRAQLCQDSVHLLLATSNVSSKRASDAHLLISRLDDWQPRPSTTINFNRIPPNVSRHVHLLLGVLLGSKLVFLDQDLWLCVYRLAELTPRRQSRINAITLYLAIGLEATAWIHVCSQRMGPFSGPGTVASFK